ncbi:glycosytransferase, putative [Flavobacteriales bacterium ALC-1]|nr:glycosytransferase, putative [Flavobacteriales bacterium ALC-1]
MPLNKVLILTNPLNHEGGVVNYYNLFFKHFESNSIALKHGSIGSRAYLFYYPILKRLLYPFFYVFDVFLYVLKLIFDRKIMIVQVSPSLIPVPLIRDGLLVLIAKLLGKKIVVFYRGWKLPTYSKINSSKILRGIFNSVFQSNTLQVVLASSFKKDLLNLSPKNLNEIMVTTTAIDKSQIVQPQKNIEAKPIKAMFLGRIQDLKGIEELIDAIGQLKKKEKLNDFKFSIVGHESKTGYIDVLKERLKTYNVSSNQVCFLGRITGKNKFELYANHDVYILPSYTEGCPNSLLEALASGLFCITTRVGALSDLIIPKENGLFVNVKDSDDLFKALQYCVDNEDFNDKRAANAERYSDEFDINKITKLFEAKYIELIENS